MTQEKSVLSSPSKQKAKWYGVRTEHSIFQKQGSRAIIIMICSRATVRLAGRGPAACVADLVGFGVGQNQQRNAGGGGRPGGRPTFSWKDKQALRLANKADKQQKPFKVLPFGDFKDIEPYLNASKGDFMVDITDSAEWSEESEKKKRYESQGVTYEEAEAEKARVANTRKVIDPSLLFGSQKTAGVIEKKYNYSGAKFSHKRIFGESKSAASAKE